MRSGRDTAATEVRALAEAVADVLVERGLIVAPSPARVVNAGEVGALLARDRRWVYAHAHELGGFRYGEGPKARLGFDLEAVERWKRERRITAGGAGAARRRQPPRGLALDRAAALIPFEFRA